MITNECGHHCGLRDGFEAHCQCEDCHTHPRNDTCVLCARTNTELQPYWMEPRFKQCIGIESCMAHIGAVPNRFGGYNVPTDTDREVHGEPATDTGPNRWRPSTL